MEQVDTEKQELTLKLEREVFTPALQKAMEQAKEAGADFPAALDAAAIAYSGMLSVFLGHPERAVEMLRWQADRLEALVQASAEKQ